MKSPPLNKCNIVTTFAVVWIEIYLNRAIIEVCLRHHLRGGVD